MSRPKDPGRRPVCDCHGLPMSKNGKGGFRCDEARKQKQAEKYSSDPTFRERQMSVAKTDNKRRRAAPADTLYVVRIEGALDTQVKVGRWSGSLSALVGRYRADGGHLNHHGWLGFWTVPKGRAKELEDSVIEDLSTLGVEAIQGKEWYRVEDTEAVMSAVCHATGFEPDSRPQS